MMALILSFLSSNKNSKFINNLGDGIDLDYCKGTFVNNKLIFESYED